MSTAEATERAEAREPSSRIKFSSPRQIPIVGVVTEDEEVQVWPGVWLWRVLRKGVEIWGGPSGNQGSPRDGGSKRKADPSEAPSAKLRCLRGELVVVNQPVWGLVSRGPPGSSLSVLVN